MPSKLDEAYGRDITLPLWMVWFLIMGVIFVLAICLRNCSEEKKVRAIPPPVTEIKLYDFSSGPESPTTKVLQAGNQNPDGSVDIKVRMSDLKIRGMGLGPTNQ
jgi:hypothetical protein